VEAIVFSLFNAFTVKEELQLLMLMRAIFKRQIQLRGHLSNRFVDDLNRHWNRITAATNITTNRLIQELFMGYFQSVDGYQYLRQLFTDVLSELLINESLVLKVSHFFILLFGEPLF